MKQRPFSKNITSNVGGIRIIINKGMFEESAATQLNNISP
jgi:hypothetical protein